jgi:hypothetical protein
MITILSALVALLTFRLRSQLELIALRHQLAVLRRQRPGRPKLLLSLPKTSSVLIRRRYELLEFLSLPIHAAGSRDRHAAASAECASQANTEVRLTRPIGDLRVALPAVSVAEECHHDRSAGHAAALAPLWLPALYLTSNLDLLVQNVSARQSRHPVMRPQVH